ncbi:hypothetical protein EG329_005526 [Mollisiaceae sp. DMI_Dod_QoI]|nr:hypothetical protein EG329_005526 [Helotiales sp. DMI_Dod_QoI]
MPRRSTVASLKDHSKTFGNARLRIETPPDEESQQIPIGRLQIHQNREKLMEEVFATATTTRASGVWNEEDEANKGFKGGSVAKAISSMVEYFSTTADGRFGNAQFRRSGADGFPEIPGKELRREIRRHIRERHKKARDADGNISRARSPPSQRSRQSTSPFLSPRSPRQTITMPADRVGRNLSRQPISIVTENRRKVLRVLIKAKEHIACPDSGSEKNIMSEALAIDQALYIRRRSKDIKKFELGSGKFIWSTGRVRVVVQLPGLALRHSKFLFYTFKTCPVPLVLGMSFLAEAEIFTRNRHVLKEAPTNLSSISSLLWIGSPRSDASEARQPPNRLRCCLDGRCLFAVVDTGSDLNMISHKCAKREGFPINTQPEARHYVRFGDGTQSETVGQVYVYNLTLDWRSAETKIAGDSRFEVDSAKNGHDRGQPHPIVHDVTEGSASDVTFHVLEGLPHDVVLGQTLLEQTNAFNNCPGLLSSKSRDKTKPYEYNILISLGPLALDSKKAHDDKRHDEMFRRSEKETEIALMPEPKRAQEKASEKQRVDDWNALHVNCVHCNPV